MSMPSLLDTSAASSADDAVDGMLMFFVFVATVLASTGAVVLIALAGTWWMLGFGFAIHVVMTAAVVLTILHVMAGPARVSAERDRSSPGPGRPEPRPRARTRPVTAP